MSFSGHLFTNRIVVLQFAKKYLQMRKLKSVGLGKRIYLGLTK